MSGINEYGDQSETLTGNDKLLGDIQSVRNRICNTFIVTIAILAIPALFASLYRATEIGWQPVMFLHIALAITLWFFTVFRHCISYHYKAGLIVLIFVSIGVAGIFQFGLIAGGVAFLITASPIATLIFGRKMGLTTLVLTLASAMVAGILIVSGILQPGIDVSEYAMSASAWMSAIFAWAFCSIALTVSLHVFNMKLINALAVSRQHEESMHMHQQHLMKIIQERDIANRQLQNALDEIHILQGVIPICSYCHNIRDDDGAWQQLEKYIAEHSAARFSHGICPECYNRVSGANNT